MIPSRDRLEMLSFTDPHGSKVEGYAPHELDFLEDIKKKLEPVPTKQRVRYGRELFERFWPDELERLQKTSFIVNKDGRPQIFWFNREQLRFWDEVVMLAREENIPCRTIICKARQIGFSTMMQVIHYFWCAEHQYRNSLTISYDVESTQGLLQKAVFNHEHQFFPRETKFMAKDTIQFAEPHGSRFRTVTANNHRAGRGDTFQYCHLSEIAMWANAEEVVTALQNAVPDVPGTAIVWESTAKGAQGLFYEAWNEAEAGDGMIPFFSPWFRDPSYSLAFPTKDHKRKFLREMTPEDREYMKLHNLDPEQMRWRDRKIRVGLNNDRYQFRQEFPATAHEAFLSTGRPAFDQDAIDRAYERVAAPIWEGDILLGT